MIKFILAAFLLLASLAQPLRAAGPPPAGPAPLNGQWKGPLKLLGGEITLYITIVPLSNGTYYAALDAPQQRISRMPVEVELKGDDLTLRIEQAGSRFVGKVIGDGASLSGTWTQPGLTAPLVLVRAVASKQAASRLRAAPPYRESDVTFLNSTTRKHLSGTVTVPAGEGPFPGVVLLSDLGPQGRDAEVSGYHMFGQLADYLTRHGIAVLRFDDRGVGKSEGTYATATTADLMTDAQAAMACLRAQPLVSGGRVGLVGHGEGANVALLAAGAPSGRTPAFVVSLAGYGEPGSLVLRHQQGEIMRLIGADPSQVKAAQDAFERTVYLIRQTPDNAVARTKVTALLAGVNTGIDAGMAKARAAQLTSPWSRYFFDFDPQVRLAQVQCPVLLLNGTEDLQVSARQNMSPMLKALRRAHRQATATRLEGVNHLFQPELEEWPVVDGAQQPTFSPEALKNIHDWVALQTKLPGAPLPVTVKRPAPRKPTHPARARS
ncbi:alpha/beta hydrolase family protein [Hymenobacter nivis]|uniref:Alpha/beta hydrolase n=1 Tax=Hymenobacter nivis TaxID=1850093 RepID=A0A502GLW0_9BACT|nr:alpha/beta hydrolase [Hymenobacter nivis]TPG62280.1 alpha/beta hydrolase [Hymenobacter nivis]